MSRLFNEIALAEPEAGAEVGADGEELIDEPGAEDFEFAERAEADKQAAFDAGRGV